MSEEVQSQVDKQGPQNAWLDGVKVGLSYAGLAGLAVVSFLVARLISVGPTTDGQFDGPELPWWIVVILGICVACVWFLSCLASLILLVLIIGAPALPVLFRVLDERLPVTTRVSIAVVATPLYFVYWYLSINVFGDLYFNFEQHADWALGEWRPFAWYAVVGPLALFVCFACVVAPIAKVIRELFFGRS